MIDKFNEMLAYLMANDMLERAFQTFWQAFVATFILQWSSVEDIWNVSFFLPTVVASIGAGLSACKTLIVEYFKKEE